mgnify:CR=1 FL=1
MLPITGTDGINLWMEVADERTALITLAAQGIGAAPGAPFMVRPGRRRVLWDLPVDSAVLVRAELNVRR